MKSKKVIDLLKSFLSYNRKFNDKHSNKLFEDVKESQSPEITLITCCDSRIHVNALTENPQNTIFTVRNIGNQISSNEGAVEFGVNVLKTPLLVIMGHSNCGAVNAAINTPEGLSDFILSEIDMIPANTDNLNEAIIENINYQVDYALEKFEDKVSDGELDVIGLLYDFSNHFSDSNDTLFVTNINHDIVSLGEEQQDYTDLI